MANVDNKRRVTAQAVVQEHVNRHKQEHSWHDVHVMSVKGTGGGEWMAIVRVQTIPNKLYTVTYLADSDDLVVDTFTRKHVSRYY